MTGNSSHIELRPTYRPTLPHAQAVRSRTDFAGERSFADGGWIVAFLLFEMACQLVMLAGPAQGMRAPFRSAGFVASIALFFLLPNRSRRRAHSSVPPALCALAIVVLNLAHPTTSSILAGLATIGMYFAVIAPLIWVNKLRLDETWVRRII